MGLIDSAVEFVSDGANSLLDKIGDSVITAISNFVGMLMYYFTNALMWFVSILQQLFDVFSGTSKVRFNGEYTYLTDVFFQDYRVNNIYWAMALIGIVFVFVFTLVAVLRKTFDISDKQQQSMGAILGSTFKSIFIMLVLSFAMSAILNLTNVTINRIGYIFDNADSLSQEREIHFTDEQYATMARIYNTIGNYSLNPSYTSRYNLNSCYNEIRSDLRYLEQQGVFNLTYVTIENGEEIDTWQSVLQELIYAGDTSHELKMDVAYEEISNALLHIMKILHTNADFKPLPYYQSGYTTINSVGLDKVLFLSGTASAAKNNKYNLAPYLSDGLRGAFYVGEKSIYSFDDVKSAFDIGITGINYIFIWVLTYFTIRNLLRCIFGCIMRLFNMVSLYLIAPLTVATMPLDNGEKFRQWTLAMAIQGLGILGMIIPMRLVILFAPIILGNDLVLFDSVTMNFLAKVLLIVGGLQAVEGFGDVVVGILANNVSGQAIRSGNTAKSMADAGFNKLSSAAATVGKFGAKAAGYTALTGLGLGLGAAAVGAGLGLAGVGLAGAGVLAGGRYIGNKIGQAYRDYKSDKASGSVGDSNGGKSETFGGNNDPNNGGGGIKGGGFNENLSQQKAGAGNSNQNQPTNLSGTGNQNKNIPEQQKPQGGGLNQNLNQQTGGNGKNNQKGQPVSKAAFDNLFGAGQYDKYVKNQQNSGTGNSNQQGGGVNKNLNQQKTGAGNNNQNQPANMSGTGNQNKNMPGQQKPQGGGLNQNLNQQAGGNGKNNQKGQPISKAAFDNLFGAGQYDKYVQNQQNSGTGNSNQHSDGVNENLNQQNSDIGNNNPQDVNSGNDNQQVAQDSNSQFENLSEPGVYESDMRGQESQQDSDIGNGNPQDINSGNDNQEVAQDFNSQLENLSEPGVYESDMRGQESQQNSDIGNGNLQDINIGNGNLQSGNIGNGNLQSGNIGSGNLQSGNIGNGNPQSGDIGNGNQQMYQGLPNNIPPLKTPPPRRNTQSNLSDKSKQ